MSSLRKPSTRKVRLSIEPVNLDDFEGESSTDSDFNIDDHEELESDDDSKSNDSLASEYETDKGSEGEGDDVLDDLRNEKSIVDLVEQAKEQFNAKSVEDVLICSACLGDRSDHSNEIVECDGCGVTVHEGCYGVSDTTSISSSESLNPTEPWFCEVCKAGVKDPVCELCPNSGGIFKATDVGRWVHLICALYIPGVAFGEVERLANVTLFEMPYSKWGAKVCGLCEDDRYARTGVHIGCDAGMCRAYFHVTCAQREGLLSEAHSEEVDQADPFYAHCKLHTDKTIMRRRRRNYLVMTYRSKQKHLEHENELFSQTPEAQRVKRKLEKKKAKYISLRNNAPNPWVPTQKMPRLLTSSSSACHALWRKAQLMGIDATAVETKDAATAVMSDINKKWHIAPAFSFEFTGYYFDRNRRIPEMKNKLEELLETNSVLSKDQEELKTKCDELMKEKEEVQTLNNKLRATITTYHDVLRQFAPDKRLPVLDDIGKQPRSTHPLSSTLSVPTAAALKAGLGYPIARSNYKGQRTSEPRDHVKNEQAFSPITNYECGLCHDKRDQHLLAKCDTCHHHYHLGCLDPPLTRMPKKTKQMGWQCSECDKGSSEDEDVLAPRSRTRRSNNDSYKNLSFDSSLSPTVSLRQLDTSQILASTSYDTPSRIKKRRREKHVRYSPEFLTSSSSGGKKHHHKKKKKNDRSEEDKDKPRIKIRIKAIPMPPGQSSDNSTMFFASSTSDTPVAVLPARRNSIPNDKSKPSDLTQCDVCLEPGNNSNLVKCDECSKCYHFSCLDPPVKKNPKRRGYSWHCADCDPTETES